MARRKDHAGNVGLLFARNKRADRANRGRDDRVLNLAAATLAIICAVYFLNTAARTWAEFNPERSALQAQLERGH